MNSYMHKSRAGFTLIELMIVVGIIAILVVVLAVAVLPALSKNDEKATISLLQNIGPEICGRKVPPTMTKFKKDAGSLSGRISGDEKIASSQMMLFYVAPSRSIWDGAKYYKDQSYNPTQQPESFAKFTRETGGGLPYLVDAWEMPIFYEYDKNAKTSFVFSNGEDTLWNTPDDLIFDVRNNQVIKREAISQ